MGLSFVDFNIFSFLFLKLDRGPYREASRAAGCSSLTQTLVDEPDMAREPPSGIRNT
jgi:hypothetical protein